MNDIYVATIEKANSILNALMLDEKIEDLGKIIIIFLFFPYFFFIFRHNRDR